MNTLEVVKNSQRDLTSFFKKVVFSEANRMLPISISITRLATADFNLEK